MMKLIIVLLFTLFISSSELAPRRSQQKVIKPTRCQLDLINPTRGKYSGFITSLRNEVVDPELKYGGTSLPVMAAPSRQFLRVDLVISTGMVSLAVLRDDLYILGYMYQNELGVNIVRHFPQVTSSVLRPLFPEVLSRNYEEIRGCTESYTSLEKRADTTRRSLGLGVNKLKNRVERIHNNAQEDVLEAEFLLLSIQMICEVARFQSIENLVMSFFPDGFSPVEKVFVLENNWGAISKLVKKSSNGNFGQTVTLTSREFPKTTLPVKDVKDLKIGVLKHCPDEVIDDTNRKLDGAAPGGKYGSSAPKQPSRIERAASKEDTCPTGLQNSVNGNDAPEQPSRRERAASKEDTCPTGLQNLVNGNDGRNYDGHSSCLVVQEAVSPDSHTTHPVEVLISPKVTLVILLVGALVTKVMFSFLPHQGNISNPSSPGVKKTLPSREKANRCQ